MHDNYEIHDLAEELMEKYSHYQLARQMVLMEMKIKELTNKVEGCLDNQNASKSSQD